MATFFSVKYNRATWACRWKPLFQRTCLVVASLAFSAASTRGEDADPQSWNGFRRVYVPADRPDLWPTNERQFIPVEAEQLQKLLKRARASDSNDGFAAARATDAVYYARYIVNRLIDGRACVEISAPSGRPAFIEWPTARAIIRDSRWRDRENEVVKFGTWGRDDGTSQQVGLLAERPGSLLFKFEAPATLQSGQWAQFAVTSPHALRRRFYIDLPGDHELISDEGRVELVQNHVSEVEEAAGAFVKLDQLGLGYRRWLLSLGPGDTMNLRVKLPSTPDRIPTKSPSYRETLRYSVTSRGIDLAAEFQFLDSHEIPEALTIELDPGLHLVGAEWGQSSLSWQELTRDSPDLNRVLLEIPSGASDLRSPLRILAWCPNAERELRKLPQLSLPDSLWSEGTLRLELAEGIELLDLQSNDLLPSSSPATSPSMSRTWDFVKLRSQAVPEIAVRKTALGVDASIGTSLELSSASTKAVTRLQLRPSGRSIPPRLEAEVLGSWEIDAVETSDASNYTDWYVDQIEGRRMLRVQLREPIDAAYPIEVVIEAHAPRSAAVEVIPLAELTPIDWRPLNPIRHLLAVTVIESLDLQIDGQVRQFNFDDLMEEDWELLQDSDFDLVAPMNEADLEASLRLLPQRPTLDAEVLFVADVQQEIVNLEATIQLSPIRVPTSKVRVQITPATTSEVRWIDPETGGQIPAVRIVDTERSAELGDVWEVQLTSGAGGQQSFQAKWSSDLTDGIAVSLVALPDAATQRATISVVANRPEELNLVATGLILHPLAILAGQSGGQPLATYRYDPAQILRDVTSCSLVIHSRTAGIAIPRAVIERADLESNYPPDRDSIHRAEFALEGIAPLRCRLPEGARLQGVAWDGQSVNVEAEKGEFRIEPPAETKSRSHTLQIDFAIAHPSLREGVVLVPALPDLGLPLSVGKWTLHLPDSLQLATPEFVRSLEPGWRGRLAGNWIGSSIEIPARRGRATPLGWHTWELDFAGSAPHPVQLLELRKRQSLAYGIGFLMACLTAWQLVGRPPLLGVLLIVSALASIWLPPTSSMFATASWLGMLIGVSWTVVMRRLFPMRALKQENATTLSMPYATVSLAFAIALLASHPLSAQIPNGERQVVADRKAQDVIDVLIPVDKKGAPAGSRHYVPAHIWEELLRSTRQDNGNEGGDWVILRGRYQGELRRDTVGGEVHASMWTLSWDVETSKRNVSVWLPLDRRDGRWETTASIDGIPASIAWDADEMGCEIVIREPGPHRIAIRVEPLILQEGQHAEVLFRLPALMDAELKLIHPSEIQDLKLPDAALPTPLDSGRSKTVITLPMNERLSLSWRSQEQSAPSPSAWQVDQVELLSITPLGAELKLRLLLQGSGAPPAEIALRIDGMLEPIETSVITDALGESRTVSIPVAIEEVGSDSNRATATASFRLGREHIFGNYRFPQVEIEGLATRSQVAAVSLADRYTYETIQSPVGESIGGSAFASLWGDSQLTIAAAHRVEGDQSPWTFSVQPRVASLSPEESLVLVCALDEVEIEFSSQVETTGIPIVRYTLQVPPELEVEDIKIEGSIGRMPVRWTRPTPDRVVLFFADPIDEYFRLTLVGSIPQRPGLAQSIPTVTSRPGEKLAQRIQVRRQPECLIKITGLAEDSLDATVRSAVLRGNETYAVAEFRKRLGDLNQIKIRTSENKSRYSSQSLTKFNPEEGVAFVSRLNVTRGELDHVILETPAEWIGPLEISPSAQVGEMGESMSGRRRVKIQFSNPLIVGQSVDLRFSGSVTATRDGAWVAPILLLADSRNSTNYVAIPGDSPTRSRWSVEGVVEVDDLPVFLREHDLSPEARVFRVRPDRRRNFAVRRLPDSQESSTASLALADVHVREDATGSKIQTTQFLLPPVGQRELLLEWPADCDPLGVYLENQLLTPMPVGVNRWRLPIGPTDLPIVVTAVSRTGIGTFRLTREFRRPQLWQGNAPYKLPLTLWTIETPWSAPAPAPATGAVGSVAELSALKLARLSQLLSFSEPQLAVLSEAERSTWKQLWMRRLQTESARLEDTAVAAEASSGQVDKNAETIRAREDLIAQVDQLLGRLAEPFAAEAIAKADPKESLRRESFVPVDDFDRRMNYYLVSGPQPDLQLSFQPPESQDSLPAIALTFILVTALGAMLRWAPGFDLTRAFADHPRWLVMVLGVFWWTFLTPAGIGVALIAAAVLTWTADRWQSGGFSTVAANS